jgi:hypothetical protein
MELSTTSIAVGVGLSAACGFRVFVPLLLMSGASLLGYLELTPEFAWVGSDRALAGFGVATVLEIIAYSVPWLDNALDAIATPAAMGAGVLASASVLGDTSPLIQWTLSIIAGGGVAGLVQSGTVAARAGSSATTGGLGNILVALGEGVASTGTALLAILAPFIALAVVLVLSVVLVRQIIRWRHRRSRSRP